MQEYPLPRHLPPCVHFFCTLSIIQILNGLLAVYRNTVFLLVSLTRQVILLFSECAQVSPHKYATTYLDQNKVLAIA